MKTTTTSTPSFVSCSSFSAVNIRASDFTTRSLRLRQRPVQRHFQTPSVRRLRASSTPGPDRPSGNTPEDEVLMTELREKLNELYGGRENVKINVDKDSSPQFIVRNKPSSSSSSSSSTALINDVFRSRRYIITFIIVVSLITGTFFTALYYSGAVHGLNSDDESRYEMPTYGTKSYVDPYELLEKEGRQLQEQQQSNQVQSKNS